MPSKWVRQGGSGKVTLTGAASPLAITYSPTAGRFLVTTGSVVDNGAGSTTVTVSDNIDTSGANWVVQQSPASGSGARKSWIAYKRNCESGITTVNCKFSNGSTQFFAIGEVSEYTGATTLGTIVDFTDLQTGTNTAVTCSGTPSQDNCLLIMSTSADDSSASGAWASNAPWTTLAEEGDTGTQTAHKSAYLVQGTAALESETMSYDVGNVPHLAAMMAFRDSSNDTPIGTSASVNNNDASMASVFIMPGAGFIPLLRKSGTALQRIIEQAMGLKSNINSTKTWW